MKKFFAALFICAIAGTLAHAIDTTPPKVVLYRPINNQTLDGKVTLWANATDNVGVTKVQFFLDGDHNILLGQSTVSPYKIIVDTSKISTGFHSIGAAAYDAAGNEGFAYSVVNIARSTAPATCNDLLVHINNYTGHTASGALEGGPIAVPSGLGSTGFDVPYGQSGRFLVPAGVQWTPYGLNVWIQKWGFSYVNIQCNAKIPSYGGCPEPNLDAVINITGGTSGQALTCQIGVPTY